MSSQQTNSNEALAQRWAARVQAGTFSPAVLGVGTIRIMGKSGDAPVHFPRITSLEALPELELDEQWAVQAAQAIVTQAAVQHRTVFAVAPGEATQLERVTTFDPTVESLIVVARVAGG